MNAPCFFGHVDLRWVCFSRISGTKTTLLQIFTQGLQYWASVVGLASAPKLPCRDFDRSASTTLGLATIGIVNASSELIDEKYTALSHLRITYLPELSCAPALRATLHRRTSTHFRFQVTLARTQGEICPLVLPQMRRSSSPATTPNAVGFIITLLTMEILI